MEKRLKQLFDYQRFRRNPRLEALLREAEARYGSGIADDDLELVSAAGDGAAAVPVADLPLEDDL